MLDQYFFQYKNLSLSLSFEKNTCKNCEIILLSFFLSFFKGRSGIPFSHSRSVSGYGTKWARSKESFDEKFLRRT